MKKLVGSAVRSICLLGLLGNIQLSNADEADRRELFDNLYSAEEQERGQSISELVASLVDSSEAERFQAVQAYIDGNDMAINRFQNLLEAVGVLGLATNYNDDLVKHYASKKEGKFTFQTLRTVLSLLSPNGFTGEDAGSNHAFAISDLFLKNRNVAFTDHWTLSKRILRANGMKASLLGQLQVTYANTQGGKLETRQTDKLMDMVGEHVEKNQQKGEILDVYVRKNAHKLTTEEFRGWVESRRQEVPIGNGLKTIKNLPAEVRQVVLQNEINYFSSMFYGAGSVVSSFQESVMEDQWKSAAAVFVERNKHRMKASHVQKIQKAFP